jgi:hypothetical protein
MNKTEKRRAEARATLLPLIAETARASNTLADWRRDAGPKSKWSNHVRMHEVALFSAFEQAAKALGEAFVPFIPAHWNMADWGFKPHRMGGKMSWGNNGGRGRSGSEISTQRSHYTSNYGGFAIEMGAFVGLATHGGAPTESEARRMRELRLSSEEIVRFSLSSHHWTEADGHSPSEAKAKLMLRGEMPGSLHLGTHPQDEAEAFDAGIARIDEDLRLDKIWSAHPHFFARLKSDRRVRKLTGGVPDAYPQLGRIGPAHVKAFDRQAAMALALLDELEPAPGKMQTFLVRPRGEKGHKVSGWCANSAMLGILLKNLFRKEIDANDMLEWEVFAMADEAGRTGRQIAAQFEPLHPE